MNEQRLQDVWYGDKPPGLLLTSLEKVYRNVSLAQAKRRLENICEPLKGKAIVVVGNITAGGTGKTPVVVRLCQLLGEAGVQTAVISRGYGRSSKTPVKVTPSSHASLAGDEPLLIAQRCNVNVWVNADREKAALDAFENGAQVVISDDGLQRLQLPRKMEICVVDGQRGLGNGRLLPAGPLREPPSRLAEVDYVVVNGNVPDPQATSHHALPTDTIPMSLQPTGFCRLDGVERLSPEEGVARLVQGGALVAMAGMGNPKRFYDTLATLGVQADEQATFSDHHQFEADQLRGFHNQSVVMTEKDAVKVRDCGLSDEELRTMWFLEVSACLPTPWERRFVREVETFSGDLTYE